MTRLVLPVLSSILITAQISWGTKLTSAPGGGTTTTFSGSGICDGVANLTVDGFAMASTGACATTIRDSSDTGRTASGMVLV